MNWKDMSNSRRPARINNVDLLHAFLDQGGQVFPEEGNVVSVRGSQGADNGSGYLVVKVPYQGRQVTTLAHRLIWTAVHLEVVELPFSIDHVNGDRLDNRISNLERVDASTQGHRSIANGRPKAGTYAHAINDVRVLRAHGLTQVNVAALVGCSRNYVQDIEHGRAAVNVPQPTDVEAARILLKYGLATPLELAHAFPITAVLEAVA